MIFCSEYTQWKKKQYFRRFYGQRNRTNPWPPTEVSLSWPWYFQMYIQKIAAVVPIAICFDWISTPASILHDHQDQFIFTTSIFNSVSFFCQADFFSTKQSVRGLLIFTLFSMHSLKTLTLYELHFAPSNCLETYAELVIRVLGTPGRAICNALLVMSRGVPGSGVHT